MDTVEVPPAVLEEQNANYLASLQQMEQKWGVNEGGNMNPLTYLQNIYGWATPAFSVGSALDTYEDASRDSMELRLWADELGDGVMAPRVTRLMTCIQESYSALVAVSNWSTSERCPPMTSDDVVQRFDKPTGDKEAAVLTVYKFVLSWCRRLQLRHKGDVVYREIISEGNKTHAWVVATDYQGHNLATTEDLLAFIVTRLHSMPMWSLYVTLPAKALCEKMRLCQEPEFSLLKTTRSWISFKDGMYSVYCDCFIYYDDQRFDVPPDLAVCAYHNTNFAPVFIRHIRPAGQPVPRGITLHPLVEIRTPLLDQIMDTQKLCGHTKFWLLSLVALYIKGRAGTGKSTIVNLLAAIYETQDVAVISNDVQVGFGLQSMLNKMLWVAPEVKTDFKMDQAQFQSIVSQERMSIARKFGTAWEGEILCHGALAGNTLPLKWVDNAGSIRRRLVVIHFKHEVKKTNTGMLVKLKTEELPAIIRKINFCYRHAVVLLDGRDLWQSKLLSPHIMRENDLLYNEMNPLRKFITGCDVVQGVDNRGVDENGAAYWCPEKVFQAAFKAWCLNNKSVEGTWNSDFYDVVFRDQGLSVREADYKWDADGLVKGRIIWGATIQEDAGKRNIPKPQENEGPNPFLHPEEGELRDQYEVTQARYAR